MHRRDPVTGRVRPRGERPGTGGVARRVGGRGGVRERPSVILIREWEEQLSGSGCCGRVEGRFLARGGEPAFPERRACMDAMGPLYRTLRERPGDPIELQVVDPRNLPSMIFLLARDFWAFRVGLREALGTLGRLPVQGVVVNGRLVARGEWPDPADVLRVLDAAADGGVPTTA